MPTQRLFDKFPPFPSDVETIDLPEISYAKLQDNDPEESRRLFAACRGCGFMALKLDDCPDGLALLSTTEELFNLNEQFHKIPIEDLNPYKFKPPNQVGYKWKGLTKLPDGSGDNIAFYNVGRDEVLGVTSQRPNPPLIEQNRGLSETFFRQAHPTMQAILRHLEIHLHLQPDTLENLNAPDKPSATHFRLIRAGPASANATSAATTPADALVADATQSLAGHTDMGTITLLFNVLGGLQVLPPGGSTDNPTDWKYVKPKPGHAVVNIADSLVEWSGQILRSNMHRVVAPPGQQKHIDRYSVGYFVRPTSKALIKRLDSKVIPVAQDRENRALTTEDWDAWRSAGHMRGENLMTSIGGGPMVEIEVGGA